jgi:GMP synthase (glutamine-hydrolysing)
MTSDFSLRNGADSPTQFVAHSIENIRTQIGADSVVMGLSGGVDSTVAAKLIHKAIGNQLFCIFVDHGLLRKAEYEEVIESYQHIGLNIKGVRAADRFFSALSGVTDPEKKRKIIGHTFIEIFDQEALQVEGAKWLGQGTIYPDVIESTTKSGKTIKSHHNVGGLPETLKLKLIEPLRTLYKDEVRQVGSALGLSPLLLSRHPFPGPGLGIRILGEVTPVRVAILQEADYIFIKGLRDNNLYNKVWQAAAILLPICSVGISGGERTYEYTIALRAVHSLDAMSADWAQLPYDFLGHISNEIINNVKGINRVVYDISSKPPATIEWE